MDYSDRYCAITEYRPGEFHRTRTSVFSFIKNNEWFTGRIIILSTDPISLTPYEESQIQRIYHDVEYRVVDLELPKGLIKRINKKSLNRSVISEYLYLYALKIKSRGNIFFSNSVVFNKDVIPFINGECVTAARKAGVLPQGSGFDVNHKLYYIPGSETSDNLYKRAVKIMGEVNNLHDPSSKSLIFTSSLLEFKIEVNIIDLHNLVDSSRFSKSRYSNFVRYSKSIVALNMNTLQNSEPNLFTRINSFWSNLNRESLAYKPKETKISKRAAEILEVKKQKRYTDNQKISKTRPKFNKNSRLIQLDIDNPDLEVSQDALNSNIALYTICNDEFMIGAKVMIQSFLKNNTWFKGDIVVLYNGTYSGLSYDSMNLLTSIYDKIKFTKVDESPYVELIHKFKKTGRSSQLRFIPSLFTFEIFEEVSKYDYLLYLDSDMLVRSDLSELFKFDHEMIVTPDAGEYSTNTPVNDFNGGFMFLSNKISRNKYRDQLISHAMKMQNMVLADQTIMNSFFTGNLYSAGVNYNCLKRCFSDTNFHNFNSNIKIVHYVGAKPWHHDKPLFETKYSKIESLWQRELSRINQEEYPNPVKKKIAVFCHLYYTDLWQELRTHLKDIGFKFDLYVTIGTDSLDAERNILMSYPNAKVYKIENRGADFGGFFTCLNNVFDMSLNYDWILKIHGKKSMLVNERKGSIWRKNLYQSLITHADIKIEDRINDSSVGMIGDSRYMIGKTSFDKRAGRSVNQENIDYLRNKYDIKDDTLSFFAGSMFWINFDILEKTFKDNRMNLTDFDRGHSPDGTLAHAMERFISNVVRDSGKRIVNI